MKVQMWKDEQILDEGFRKQVIQEIEGSENRQRKERQAACWEILRDQIPGHVMARLKTQGFNDDTLKVMEGRVTNVNLLKKIVSKKARSYSKGVNRSVSDDKDATADIELVAKSLGLTGAMKRADKYRHAARNCLLYIYPQLCEDPDGSGKDVLMLTAKVYFPHLYDAIPDAMDREQMRCLVLSPFSESSSLVGNVQSIGSGDGRNLMNVGNPVWQRDMVDQTIANHPRDDGAMNASGKKKKEYVFWTRTLHLTCDENGAIVEGEGKSPTDRKNPIQRIPAVNICMDQDGEFWSLGGDDLVNATVLVNLKLTDMESILHYQGWGQLVVEGQDLTKKTFKVGPQHALMMESAADATHPTKASILSHDPHTDDHLKSVEVHVALTLTTNNLSVKSVSTNLNASSLSSGIAKLVDEAENMDDITEDQEYYGTKERQIFRIAESWLEALRDTANLWKRLKETKPLKVNEMTVRYNNVEQIVTEQERLAVLEARKALGIDGMIDTLKRDDPSLNDEQAEQKALKIMNEKTVLQLKAVAEARKAGGDPAQPKPADPNTPAVPLDPAAPAAGAVADDVRKETLNGAQITAIVELVQAVAEGNLPRAAAVQIIMTSFNLTQPEAEKLVADAGKGFKIDKPEPAPSPFKKPEPEEDEE